MITEFSLPMADPFISCTSPYFGLAGTSSSDFDGDLFFGSNGINLDINTPLLSTPVMSKSLIGGDISEEQMIKEEESLARMIEDPEFKEFDKILDDLTARNNALSPLPADLFDGFGSPFPQLFPASPTLDSPQLTSDVGTDPPPWASQPALPSHQPVILSRPSLTSIKPQTTKIIQLTSTVPSCSQTQNNNVVRPTQASFIQISSNVPSKPTVLIATPLQSQPQSLPPGCIMLQLQESSTTTMNANQFVTAMSATTTKDEIVEECFAMEEDKYFAELPMTPSTESESADDHTRTTSPDGGSSQYTSNDIYIKASPPASVSSSPTASSYRAHVSTNHSSSTLTDLERLPSSGTLALSDEEIKLLKQDGYSIPFKLPLNKNDQKILKKIRRKIKNKLSAQESRRKKKEYVDALERKMAKYIDENKALKEKQVNMEKNQKTLMQELQSLRSMVGKGTTATGTVLMVLVLFFAVLFGVWSPIVSKPNDDFLRPSVESSLSPSSSNSQDTSSSSIGRRPTTTSRSMLDRDIKQEPSYYSPQPYKSRVLLSFDDEYNQQHQHDNYGPYLPPSQKQRKGKWGNKGKSEFHAPAYTYSNAVEKYMNKKIKFGDKERQSEASNYSFPRSVPCGKRPISLVEPSIVLSPLSDIAPFPPTRSNHTSNYRINEKVVVASSSMDKREFDSAQQKPLKIIRVERTTPALSNDTLKHQLQQSS